jgi:hypothetical protein
MRRSLRSVAVFVALDRAVSHAVCSRLVPIGDEEFFSTHLSGEVIASADMNAIQDEIVAIENGLLTGIAHNFLPDGDVTRSFGSNAKRWLHPSGTVTAPGVAVGATGVGMYSSGTNALELGTNGTKALGIDSTQFIDSPTQPRCVVYANAVTQSLANNTATAIQFNAEDVDTPSGMHDTAVNNTRITIPAGGDGLYLIYGTVQYANNGTGIRRAWVQKNGTTALNSATITTADGTSNTQTSTTAIAVLAATDYVELMGQQNSTAALNTSTSGTRDVTSNFGVVKLW